MSARAPRRCTSAPGHRWTSRRQIPPRPGAGSVGYLVGSVHPLQCWFQSDYGPRYPYYGLVRRLGLDIGFTQQSSLGWAVLAPTRRIGPGDLSGSYGGVTAGAAIGIGGNA